MGIKVTRGDTPTYNVKLADASGEPYELQEGDALTFTVKASTKVSDPVLVQKVMTSETGPSFRLTEQDTALDYGTYRYDVELRTAAGDVLTVVKPDKLEITAEVTTHD